MVFDPGFGGFRPAGPPTTRACAHRYQEGRAHTGQPPCWCGVLAIGHCTSCRQSVCGVHSEQVPQLLCGACWARWNAERQRRSAHEQAAAREKRVAQEAAEIEARKQAARRRQVQLEALPAADLNDVQRYLAHGRGQVAPTDWSLRAGVRLEPLPFAVLPKLLLAAGYLPPGGTYPPPLRLLRGRDTSSYSWPLCARDAGETANGRRWEWTETLGGDGRVRGRDSWAQDAGILSDTVASLSDLFTLAARRYSER